MRSAIGLSRVGLASGAALAWLVLAMTVAGRGEELGPAAESDPFNILGVDRDASDADIKATHRRLVKENHPDRLIARGVPEEFVRIATERLAAINAAWDIIELQRGDRRRDREDRQ